MLHWTYPAHDMSASAQAKLAAQSPLPLQSQRPLPTRTNGQTPPPSLAFPLVPHRDPPTSRPTAAASDEPCLSEHHHTTTTTTTTLFLLFHPSRNHSNSAPRALMTRSRYDPSSGMGLIEAFGIAHAERGRPSTQSAPQWTTDHTCFTVA